jgi:hypothetical protein
MVNIIILYLGVKRIIIPRVSKHARKAAASAKKATHLLWGEAGAPRKSAQRLDRRRSDDIHIYTLFRAFLFLLQVYFLAYVYYWTVHALQWCSGNFFFTGTPVGRRSVAQRPRTARGRAGGWVREGVAPSRNGGPGVLPPEVFIYSSLL